MKPGSGIKNKMLESYTTSKFSVLETSQVAIQTKCSWCGEIRRKKEDLYSIYSKQETMSTLKGYICKHCAFSAAQALVLWGQDGSLF